MAESSSSMIPSLTSIFRNADEEIRLAGGIFRVADRWRAAVSTIDHSSKEFEAALIRVLAYTADAIQPAPEDPFCPGAAGAAAIRGRKGRHRPPEASNRRDGPMLSQASGPSLNWPETKSLFRRQYSRRRDVQSYPAPASARIRAVPGATALPKPG